MKGVGRDEIIAVVLAHIERVMGRRFPQTINRTKLLL